MAGGSGSCSCSLMGRQKASLYYCQEIAITVASQGIGRMSVGCDRGNRLGGLHHPKVDSPSRLRKGHQSIHHPLAFRLRETYGNCHRGTRAAATLQSGPSDQDVELKTDRMGSLYISLQINGIPVMALVDTGSTFSVIHPTVLSRISEEQDMVKRSPSGQLCLAVGWHTGHRAAIPTIGLWQLFHPACNGHCCGGGTSSDWSWCSPRTWVYPGYPEGYLGGSG